MADQPLTDTPPQADGVAKTEPGVMPLLEHLKELRTRLIRAFLALAVTTGISFLFVRQVLQFLIEPMGDTLGCHATADDHRSYL